MTGRTRRPAPCSPRRPSSHCCRRTEVRPPQGADWRRRTRRGRPRDFRGAAPERRRRALRRCL